MGQQRTTGKLAAGRLERLLSRYATRLDPGVVVGPALGLDAAALRVPAGVLVVASDPVTYAADELGTYAVHINANDVFVSGAEPRWFLADILLPPDQERAAEGVFKQIHQACEELGVSLVGGHTELTPGLPRPMVVGFMMGQLIGEQVLTAGGVQPGDVIMLTKGVAIEGTAIIARDREEGLQGQLSTSALRRARRFLKDPGLSVGPEARIAACCGVHAMHDPTEGGLLNGLWEMSQASGLALDVDVGRVPIYAETRAICDHFRLDPLKLLASGALLIACPEGAVGKLLAGLTSAGIRASEIGGARKNKPGVYFRSGMVMRRSVPDEILKVLDDGG